MREIADAWNVREDDMMAERVEVGSIVRSIVDMAAVVDVDEMVVSRRDLRNARRRESSTGLSRAFVST